MDARVKPGHDDSSPSEMLAGDEQARYLRVVALEDGETVHNAFFDRDFRGEEQ